MSKDFLTVKDVAELLAVKERTVRALFKKGIIKARKIAGKYITTTDLLKAYIEQGKDELEARKD